MNDEVLHCLASTLGLPAGEAAFPWQEALLQRFLQGEIPAALDVPTGLGKTSLIAIWVLARALGAAVPRRLVYVVDRRAVVDQATTVAEDLRAWIEKHPDVKQGLGLGDRKLPISTLRGQHADNREWLDDPSVPAIVIGTVDMIGSRLLFEGYGVSSKMRPYHAGVMGTDTLVALDEAHLVPPFEKLVQSLATDDASLGAASSELQALIPRFRTISLSATGQGNPETTATLTQKDFEHEVVERRLKAKKELAILDYAPKDGRKPAEVLAERAFALSSKGTIPARIIIFSDSRKSAEEASIEIRKLANREKRTDGTATKIDCELFVGGRRVFERQEAAERLASLGFIAGSKTERTNSAFVFATAAGEVGVDLDADHMVCDLVEWERMVQRLGRVNRRGERDARVEVIPIPNDDESRDARFTRVRDLLGRLPVAGEFADASPGALRELELRSRVDKKLADEIDAASTPPPLRPALTRAHIDAWAMTSLAVHTGRPEVAPWIRGWVDEQPQTTIVWRRFLPQRIIDNEVRDVSDRECAEFFEAAPPHLQELLEVEVDRAFDWLLARAALLLKQVRSPTTHENADPDLAAIQMSSLIAVLRSSKGEIIGRLHLKDFAEDGASKTKKRWVDDLKDGMSGATLIADARLGGLTHGLLDPKAELTTIPPTADGRLGAVMSSPAKGISPTDDSREPLIPFRLVLRRSVDRDESTPDGRWNTRLVFPFELNMNGESVREIDIEKWEMSAETEDDRSESHPQSLIDHQEEAATFASTIADALALPADYKSMLVAATRLHDEGKRSARWQRAFSAPKNGGPYAKTRGPVRPKLLDGYRHELGSLLVIERSEKLAELPDELRDLALHLVIAHHGFGRPTIVTSGCDDTPPTALKEQAREIALRFIRLQARWGPWGLAWWESLLRAADQRASRENDKRGAAARKRGISQ